MKIGNDCHKCMKGVMGNSQHIGHGDVIMVVNGITLEIPAGFYTKKGVLRKKYQKVVAEAILNARARVAA